MPVNTFLLTMQWVVSLIGVFGGAGLCDCRAFKENWKLGLACLLFPAFLLYYVPTRWARCRVPFAVFAVAFVAAALFQRARLGYWGWPDVGASSVMSTGAEALR